MLRALHTQRRSMYGGQSTQRVAAPRGIISRRKSFMDPKLETLRHFRPIHHTNRSMSCEHFASMMGDDFLELAQFPRTYECATFQNPADSWCAMETTSPSSPDSMSAFMCAK